MFSDQGSIESAKPSQPNFQKLSEKIFSAIGVDMGTDGLKNFWEKRYEDDIKSSQAPHYLAALFLVLEADFPKNKLNLRAFKGNKTKLDSKHWLDYIKFYNGENNTQPDVDSINSVSFNSNVFFEKNDFQSDYYIVINENYWNRQKHTPTTLREKISYITEINSSSKLLPRIVANENYIHPSIFLKLKTAHGDWSTINIKELFAYTESCSIIKIADAMGQGKSTFTWHIGKLFAQSHFVIYITDKIDRDSQIKFPPVFENKAILFLIDNCSSKPLFEILTLAKNVYEKKTLIFCLIDQTFNFNNIEDWDDITEEADLYETELIHSHEFYENTFNLLITSLKSEDNSISESDIEEKKVQFLKNDNRSTLVDRIYYVLDQLNKSGKIRYRGLDWQVWENLTRNKEKILKDLFCIVSTYYQFGMPIPMGIFKNHQEIIIRFLSPKKESDNQKYPIILENDRLSLRHESSAALYLKEPIHKNLAISKFKERLSEPINGDFIYLLRNVYWLNDFKHSFLINSFIRKNEFYEKCLNVFETYLKDISESNKTEILKTKMELSKIHYQLGNKLLSFELLNSIVALNFENDIHARTFLISLYYNETLEKRVEALILSKKVLSISNDNERVISKIDMLLTSVASEQKFLIVDFLMDLFNDNLISSKSLYRICRKILLYYATIKPNDGFILSGDFIFQLVSAQNIHLTKVVITSVEFLLENSDFYFDLFIDKLSYFFNNAQFVDNKEEMFEAWAAKLYNSKRNNAALKILQITKIKSPLYTTNNLLLGDHYIINKMYEECIMLIFNYKGELIPPFLILLTNAYIALKNYDAALVFVKLLEKDPSPNSRKLAIIKNAEICFKRADFKNLIIYLTNYFTEENIYDKSISIFTSGLVKECKVNYKLRNPTLKLLDIALKENNQYITFRVSQLQLLFINNDKKKESSFENMLAQFDKDENIKGYLPLGYYFYNSNLLLFANRLVNHCLSINIKDIDINLLHLLIILDFKKISLNKLNHISFLLASRPKIAYNQTVLIEKINKRILHEKDSRVRNLLTKINLSIGTFK